MSGTRVTPGATDLLVALGVGAASCAALIASPALLGADEAPAAGGVGWWSTFAVLVLQALLLVAVRAAPRVVLTGTAAAALLLETAVPTGIGTLADAAVLVAVTRVTLLVPSQRLRVPLPVAGLLVAGGQAADLLGSSGIEVLTAAASGILQAIAIVGLPAAGVLAFTAGREARRARSGESAAVERERDALVRAAVAQERTGMARELHDIAAHHVSGIALMAAAIERQIDADPRAAKDAVRTVRAQSRALLEDLRRLVGLLRDDRGAPDAVESLSTVVELVDAARATGRAVELRNDGDAAGVGPLAQLVVFRMVQEALANAAQHAPGAACRVELDGSAAGTFTATVRNGPATTAPSTASGGFGLVGMRERAALVGGELEAGPDADGGWTVRLHVPAEAPVSHQEET